MGVDWCTRVGGMRQRSVATAGFERYGRTTRRAAFLAEIERVVLWSALCALIEPYYPKPGNGRPPVGVERMLRIYFCINGSTCRTRRWKRRSMLRRRCAVLSGSISGISQCPTKPRCAAFAICSKPMISAAGCSTRCSVISPPMDCSRRPARLSIPPPSSMRILDQEPRPGAQPRDASNQEAQLVVLWRGGACRRRPPHQSPNWENTGNFAR
jgi:hypothetical protein